MAQRIKICEPNQDFFKQQYNIKNRFDTPGFDFHNSIFSILLVKPYHLKGVVEHFVQVRFSTDFKQKETKSKFVHHFENYDGTNRHTHVNIKFVKQNQKERKFCVEGQKELYNFRFKWM